MTEKDQSLIEDLEKKLLTASPEVAQFQVHFEQLQEILQKCREKIAEIKAGDPATAEKLANAVKTVCRGVQTDDR